MLLWRQWILEYIELRGKKKPSSIREGYFLELELVHYLRNLVGEILKKMGNRVDEPSALFQF